MSEARCKNCGRPYNSCNGRCVDTNGTPHVERLGPEFARPGVGWDSLRYTRDALTDAVLVEMWNDPGDIEALGHTHTDDTIVLRCLVRRLINTIRAERAEDWEQIRALRKLIEKHHDAGHYLRMSQVPAVCPACQLHGGDVLTPDGFWRDTMPLPVGRLVNNYEPPQ